MLKYTVVRVMSLESVDGPYPTVVSEEFKDIREAEKARSGYLALFPSADPQNVQVIQYVI